MDRTIGTLPNGVSITPKTQPAMDALLHNQELALKGLMEARQDLCSLVMRLFTDDVAGPTPGQPEEAPAGMMERAIRGSQSIATQTSILKEDIQRLAERI